jgi:hypothetical protein
MGEGNGNIGPLDVFKANVQSLLWGFEHWLLTKPLRKEFCHSCSGYFHANTTVAG